MAPNRNEQGGAADASRTSISSRSGPFPAADDSIAASTSTSTSITTSSSGTSKFTGSRSSSSSSSSTSLLDEWATHTSAAYHDFDPAEAADIRAALLEWYRSNRRKLPWRGDPPPYDGSTAGINGGGDNGGSKNKKKGRKGGRNEDENQPSISKFFAVKGKKSSEKKKTTTEEKLERNAKSAAEEKKDDDDKNSNPPPPNMNVTAYGTWVSEIMLQQTRVEAVIPYYLKWMARFPTVHDLASASEEDVNSHWAGLGFYRRARMLHAGAQRVVREFDGQVPSTVEKLMELEGVGRYTASAIASIAFGECVPVVDGNVCRVLARLRGVANHIKAPVFKDDVGWELAGQIVRAGGGGEDAGEVNQALMELGATYCSPSGTGVDERDPLREFYISTRIGRAARGVLDDIDEFVSSRTDGGRKGGRGCSLCDPDGVATVLSDISRGLSEADDCPTSGSDATAAVIGHGAFPIAPPKKAKREEVVAVAAIRCCSMDVGHDDDNDDDDGGRSREDQWLMVKRPKDGLLAGQWEFPSVCVWSSSSGTVDMNNKMEQNKLKKKKAAPKKTGSSRGEAKNVEVALVKPRERRSALDSFLGGISSSQSDEDESLDDERFAFDREQVGEAPIEHIFSHVRHTMWLEYGELSSADDAISSALATDDGREVRFMTEDDMKTVGITSGVKKVLAAVKKAKLNSRRQTNPKKRRRKR